MVKVAVVGASGYSGAELVRLLSGHPAIQLTRITSTRYVGQKICDLYTNLTGVCDLAFQAYDVQTAKQADVVFVALPHGKSMEVVPEITGDGRKVVDLSGDFRLPVDVYEQWYQNTHTAPDLIQQAVYGLPEINRAQISSASLVANPGCYPTSVILALAPAVQHRLIEPAVSVVSQSGISGAGRALKEAVHFCQADENLTAYKVGGVHQHIPEMELHLGDPPLKVTFVPILAPISRGIYSTVYANLKADIGSVELTDLYAEFYGNAPFVRVLPDGRYPEVKAVAGTNFCHLGLAVDSHTGQLIVLSALDNLGKGAAGQAIQNMNLILGLEETTGLMQTGLYP